MLPLHLKKVLLQLSKNIHRKQFLKHKTSIMKQVNLNDFDFSQPSGMRFGVKSIADAYAVFGVKGKNRKYDKNVIMLTSFYKRTGATFEKLTIGTNKFADGNAIFLFDSQQYPGMAIGQNKSANVVYANGKGYISKLFAAFNIVLPTAPGSSVRFFFDLEETDSGAFNVVPVRVEKIDPYGVATVTDLKNGDNKSKAEHRRADYQRRTAY